MIAASTNVSSANPTPTASRMPSGDSFLMSSPFPSKVDVSPLSVSRRIVMSSGTEPTPPLTICGKAYGKRVRGTTPHARKRLAHTEETPPATTVPAHARYGG